jgi:hypothetical protein
MVMAPFVITMSKSAIQKLEGTHRADGRESAVAKLPEGDK